MLKREIKYIDFNDEEQTDIVYFNLSKAELVEFENEVKGGMMAVLQRIVESRDNHEIVQLFKRIILMAYGKKSDDGKSFLKNEELRKEFEQTAAYQSLFFELCEKPGAGAEFVNGILPKDMRDNNQSIPGLESANQS